MVAPIDDNWLDVLLALPADRLPYDDRSTFAALVVLTGKYRDEYRKLLDELTDVLDQLRERETDAFQAAIEGLDA